MKQQENVIMRRPPLDERQKQLMLAIIIRNQEAFENARETLKVEALAENTAPELTVVWQTVLEFYKTHGELPDIDVLLAELQARISNEPDLLTTEEIKRMDQYVGAAFHMKRRSLKAKVGMNYLKRFMEDRIVSDLRTIFTLSAGTPEDIGQIMEKKTAQINQLSALQDSPIDMPFPDGWNAVPPILKSPTGIGWLDSLTNGGDAPGEVLGYAGPFGSCKTLFATQLSTQAARLFATEYRRNAGGDTRPVLKLSYHVTYEEPLRTLRVRALSHIGMIERNVLETGIVADLSTSRNPKPYEREMAKFNHRPLQGELGRWEFAQRTLNFNWRPVDFTGTMEGREHLGNGGIPEIAQAISNDLKRQSRMRRIPCAAGKINIDYVGVACKRYLDARGIVEHGTELRHQLTSFPEKAKRLLAERFECSVHAFAQLSGIAASLPPGVVCKKTDTAESKLFLENCDFGITFGNYDKEGRCVVALQKARRSESCKQIVVIVNGLMCRIEDAREEYVYSEQRRCIMSKEDLSRIDSGLTRNYQIKGGVARRLTPIRSQTSDMTI